jgi:class 3 adenylate cyclase
MLKDQLTEKVKSYANSLWAEIPKGRVVPTPENQNLTHGNTGVNVDVTVLYADIKDSTKMVDELPPTRSAEYYKAYLECGARVIKENNGTITAYDGDRIMAIFIGDSQVVDAVNTALQLNWVVRNIVNPIFSDMYGESHRELSHTIGIDKGEILATKAGVRLDNDIVWIGAPANYAAKLNSFEGLDPEYQIRITSQALSCIPSSIFVNASGETIWDGPYTNLGRGQHYRTYYCQPID